MATTTNGEYVKQYVEPQLLEEFKNFNDAFIGSLKRANAAAIDKDGIKFNKLISNVGFHVNKSTEFTPKKMNGEKTLVEYDKLDTDPTSITDKELRAMAYDKESEVRKKHTESFKIGVRDYALSKLAPAQNTSKTPVIRTTGANDGNGRKRLTYEDLVGFYSRLEQMNLTNPMGWNFILSAEHKSDLLLDKSSTNNFRDIQIDSTTGIVKKLYKMKLHENNDTPIYDNSGLLKSTGAVIGGTDRKSSVFFYSPNTVYHIESVKVLFKNMAEDTRNADPTSEIRLHTYGLCDKVQDYGFGALVSGIV